MKHALAAVRCELEDGASVHAATVVCRTVEIAGEIAHRRARGGRAVRVAREGMQDRLAAVGGQAEERAATAGAGAAAAAAGTGGAGKAAVRLEQQAGLGQ